MPQSESDVSASNGSCQWLFTAMVVASRATIACDSGCVYWLIVPVETKMVFVAASTVGDVHTPPPCWPSGTNLATLVTAWLVRLTCRS